MPCPKTLFRGGEGRKAGERAGGGGERNLNFILNMF
jgi:hypothetical protein